MVDATSSDGFLVFLLTYSVHCLDQLRMLSLSWCRHSQFIGELTPFAVHVLIYVTCYPLIPTIGDISNMSVHGRRVRRSTELTCARAVSTCVTCASSCRLAVVASRTETSSTKKPFSAHSTSRQWCLTTPRQRQSSDPAQVRPAQLSYFSVSLTLKQTNKQTNKKPVCLAYTINQSINEVYFRHHGPL